MRRTPRLLAPPLLAALLLGGCTTPDPAPTPPHTTDAAPVFASDEEALAAAEEAYGKYIATVDAILNDGGADPERLEPLVSTEVYTRELEGFRSYQEHGWRGVGSTSFALSLQGYNEANVTAYVCEDLSATDVLDSTGASITPTDSPTLYAFQIAIQFEGEPLLTSKEPWDSGGVCGA